MKIEHLNKTYDPRSSTSNHVLKDVSFTLPDTGFVCILGPSGCGKTSLLNAIGGLDRFDSGEISVGDVTVKEYGTAMYEAERNRSFGYIFQNYYLLQNHSVAYNVYLGLHSTHLSHSEKLRRVRQALEAVDMVRYLRRRVRELSGGQQQRVAIARALARRPRVIFADEPTGNLDEANTINICTLLKHISRNSLVVMVTHEERIARFFADRIIRLEDGRVRSGGEYARQEALTLEKSGTLYTGDYTEQVLDAQSLSLRILSEPDAAPANLTVAVLKDRIVIKVDDGRSISCGTSADTPILEEGTRPVMTMETLTQSGDMPILTGEAPPPGKAGQGLTFAMMASEARELMRGRGRKWVAAWIFMVLLTALSIWMTGDYLTLKSIDPRDFVVTDSHILEMHLERGENFDFDLSGNLQGVMLRQSTARFLEELQDTREGFEIMPHVVLSAVLSTDQIFPQLDSASVKLKQFSFVPVDYLSENSLILGRMPESPYEIVVDRWVLDAVLREDGVLPNAIPDISFFLNKYIRLDKLGFGATIVGISDDSEAAIYASRSLIASAGNNVQKFLTLSELQQLFPGVYDDLVIAEGMCVTVKRDGTAQNKPGDLLTFNTELKYTIQQEIEADVQAVVIVADDQIPAIVRSMATISTKFMLYCPEKASVKEDLISNPLSQEADKILQVDILDSYTDSWNQYRNASTMKADARTIVTATVLVAAAVMLYLLRRTQVQSRMEMLAVYRLLGIPRRKLAAIFSMESGLMFALSALPTAMVTYLVVTVLTSIEDIAFSMVLPWQAAAAVAAAILAYSLVVTLIPLRRLLHLPPAQLAARYDF